MTTKPDTGSEDGKRVVVRLSLSLLTIRPPAGKAPAVSPTTEQKRPGLFFWAALAVLVLLEFWWLARLDGYL